jgi:hypothetical protein
MSADSLITISPTVHQIFTEVQGMSSIVFDNEVSCPQTVSRTSFNKANPISLQRICRGRDVVYFKIEMERSTFANVVCRMKCASRSPARFIPRMVA